ncbi:MAG: hypothetical protein JST92_09780 [Deltaproteobacteria bacterium]|nr:hypothetical protein [Deltaproteobacteria bacterium]
MNSPDRDEPEVPAGAPPATDSDGLPTQDENGVDLTLIREKLRRTPRQRLDDAAAYMRALSRVRRT